MYNRAHTVPKTEADASTSRVEFTAEEHRQLCEAVAAAVSEVLGAMPVAVDFYPEAVAFLVQVVGQAPPSELH